MSAEKRPAWLPNGCPSWCDWIGDHNESARYDDRSHIGAGLSLILTAEQTLREDRKDTVPPTLDIYLIQHYREAEPRVHVGRDDMPGTHLTLDEAEALANKLLNRVATARQAAAQVTR